MAITRPFRHAWPDSITSSEVVYHLGMFDEWEIEKLLDPYSTSARTLDLFVAEKYANTTLGEIVDWFEVAEVKPRENSIVTFHHFQQNKMHLGLHIKFNNENDALMFRLRWM